MQDSCIWLLTLGSTRLNRGVTKEICMGPRPAPRVMPYGSCKSWSAWTTVVVTKSNQGGPGHEESSAFGAGA
jgi:hypothetical protein